MLPTVLVALLCLPPTVPAGGPPTEKEVEDAYRSKVQEFHLPIPGVKKKKGIWAVKEIRGWTIGFRHVKDERAGTLLKQRYQAVAGYLGECYEYEVAEVFNAAPPPHYLKNGIYVELLGRAKCK